MLDPLLPIGSKVHTSWLGVYSHSLSPLPEWEILGRTWTQIDVSDPHHRLRRPSSIPSLHETRSGRLVFMSKLQHSEEESHEGPLSWQKWLDPNPATFHSYRKPSPEKPSNFKNAKTKCNATKLKGLNENPTPSFREQVSLIGRTLAVNFDVLPTGKTTDAHSCPILAHDPVLHPCL